MKTDYWVIAMPSSVGEEYAVIPSGDRFKDRIIEALSQHYDASVEIVCGDESFGKIADGMGVAGFRHTAHFTVKVDSSAYLSVSDDYEDEVRMQRTWIY